MKKAGLKVRTEDMQFITEIRIETDQDTMIVETSKEDGNEKDHAEIQIEEIQLITENGMETDQDTRIAETLKEDENKEDHLEIETIESESTEAYSKPSCSKWKSQFVSHMRLRRREVVADKSELPDCSFVASEEKFDDTDNDPNFESASDTSDSVNDN
ncbi:hypothetical protein RF55_25829 [Lasius niger]|uniref:Uncharacterized protein n=1 Tax=Lasius niger TaxID=67767 RepID=A0A0J7JUT5_LASNI|nr:hypothetical protein RF55_25829 [Lasius niger]